MLSFDVKNMLFVVFVTFPAASCYSTGNWWPLAVGHRLANKQTLQATTTTKNTSTPPATPKPVQVLHD